MPRITDELRVTVVCGRCEDVMNAGEAILSPDSVWLCEGCWNDNCFMCNECLQTLWNDDYEEEGICRECYRNNTMGAIETSSYMPKLIFSKEPWENTLYQGVELEIELPEHINPNEHAKRFKKWLQAEGIGQYIYLKHDGSIDNGYEIVSHPFTSQARHRILNWKKVLEYLRNHGARTLTSCGMHVHVSREPLTIADIKKLKLFFWANQEEIKKVAGRGENSFCNYEEYTMREYRSNRVNNNDTRYLAVNVNIWHGKRDTVEFRIFKGTLDSDRFIGCLQFTEAVCEFVRHYRATQLDKPSAWGLFKTWLAKSGKYSTLIKFLKEVNA